MRLAKALNRSFDTTADKAHGNQKVLQDLREMNRLTDEMRKAESLRSLFWTEEELKDLQYVKDYYEFRIQNMIRGTLANLDWYQKEGWKKFADEGEESS